MNPTKAFRGQPLVSLGNIDTTFRLGFKFKRDEMGNLKNKMIVGLCA
jgi:hypothetical protein